MQVVNYTLTIATLVLYLNYLNIIFTYVIPNYINILSFYNLFYIQKLTQKNDNKIKIC